MVLPAKASQRTADSALGLSFHAGVAHSPEAGQPAKLQVNLYSSPKLSLWVLDTDYSSYAVVYSCSLKLGGMTSDQVSRLSLTPCCPVRWREGHGHLLTKYGSVKEQWLDLWSSAALGKARGQQYEAAGTRTCFELSWIGVQSFVSAALGHAIVGHQRCGLLSELLSAVLVTQVIKLDMCVICAWSTPLT
jgi:hypothetical protein